MKKTKLSSFVKDLKFGVMYEHHLIALLTATEGKDKILSSSIKKIEGNHKEYDLVLNKPSFHRKRITIEVKADRRTQETNNMCIEHRCNNKDSGITTTTANYWYYFVHQGYDGSKINYSGYFKIPTIAIRHAIDDKKFFKDCAVGEGAEGYLFKREVFEKYFVPK